MKKPYIFAHRGAMGYEIENTLASFKTAVEMGAGIESDIRLTADKRLVCFHDASFQIGDKWHSINNLTCKELKTISFPDKRKVPHLRDVFQEFDSGCKNLRYSFDIGSRKAALGIISLAKKFKILDKIEITDTSDKVLYSIRRKDKEVNLVLSVPYHIAEINQNTVNFEKLKDHNINVLNLKSNRAKEKNFRNIIDHGFKCYVWNINGKGRMKKTLRLRYKDEIVSAMYTNYPDVLIEIRDNFFS
ncbi:MAG: glycerophosphodiester phosphodiesterase [Promethearchaeota archaeon]|nr:MAG: glycerophosphodiester phosphodiesterase [Candidatus Lokiarchaeota archaeon]